MIPPEWLATAMFYRQHVQAQRLPFDQDAYPEGWVFGSEWTAQDDAAFMLHVWEQG